MENLRGKIGLELVDKGLWRIDGIYGKNLCLISLERNDKAIKLYDTPTHGFCEEFLDKMLEAEWKNDNFIFQNGIYGNNSKRPPQLPEKIGRLEKILTKWRVKILE